MEKSWNSISWEKSWKSHGNSNSGKENLFWFALQCLYYHIGRDLIKISLDPNMPCSLAEICAMTLYWLWCMLGILSVEIPYLCKVWYALPWVHACNIPSFTYLFVTWLILQCNSSFFLMLNFQWILDCSYEPNGLSRTWGYKNFDMLITPLRFSNILHTNFFHRCALSKSFSKS